MNLQELLVQQRARLQPCDTLLTLPNGKIIKETRISSDKTDHVIVGYSAGFIVDNKPDLQVAEILPGLCMGSQDVVFTPGVLNSHNITHVLSLGVVPELSIDKIQHCFVPLLDNPETELFDAVDQSISFIEIARKVSGRVFVHCNAGVSRSATIVIAYLMKDGLSFKDAYEMVRSKRPVIRPNDGFIKYLKDLEKRERF